MASSPRDKFIHQDAEECAREPIHIPGSIQPHGVLLVVAASNGIILQASRNAAMWFYRPTDTIIGRTLSEVAPEAAALLSARPALLEGGATHLGDVAIDGGRRVALLVHRVDDAFVVEFEPADDLVQIHETLYPLVRTFLPRLQAAQDVGTLCELAVQEIQRVTGFGRVLAYDFDAEGHGHVLAEACAEGYATYDGLHFPASDIPPQARDLYVRNRIRVIHDADYEPSPIEPVLDKPLDLSYSVLRSVSPVHVQYMKNMGTFASMSVSIIVDGQLWGLISCHHLQARHVPLHVRTACELLSRVLSLQIEAMERHALVSARFRLRRDIVTMLTAMSDCDSVTRGLMSVPDTFVSFVEADGAAVVAGERCERFGLAPSRETVLALCQWLGAREGQDVFQSINVSQDIPELPTLADACAGVLAVPISSLHSHYLLWFRQEQVQTVNWAGKPEKLQDTAGRLSPRHSFSLWEETVHNYSRRWVDVDAEAARELRNAVLGLVLRKAEEKAQLASDLAESNRELEAFSYSVSHDLRAPLRHIAGYTELLTDTEGDKLSERGRRFLSNIEESARFAGTLVDNLLSFSQMGRAALRYSDVSLQALVDTIRSEMAPDLEGRVVKWKVDPLPVVLADAAFVHLALRNLLGNAVKYTRQRNPAIIEVGARLGDDEVVIFVKDNGVGFNMKYANKLFGVFQRLHRMEDFEGTGIGLASVRRIIERHDGRVWAEGEPDHGATFYFSLPHHGATR